MELKEQIKVVTEAIVILESAPDNRWTIHIREDNNGNHCAYGFLDSYDRTLSLSMESIIGNHPYFKVLNTGYPCGEDLLSGANNGTIPGYPQSTAKQRSIAALSDLLDVLTKELGMGRKDVGYIDLYHISPSEVVDSVKKGHLV